MGHLIRLEARARRRPAVLCVAEPDARQPIPWSLIYDRWVGDDPGRYRVCESVDLMGPGATGPIPPHCPVSDHEDEQDILCPFGFWGLSCIVEQPPSSEQDATAVVSRSDPPRSVLVATGSKLDARITERHLAVLGDSLSDAVLALPVDSERELSEALAEENMDVAYLYCHCEYEADGSPRPRRTCGSVPRSSVRWTSANGRGGGVTRTGRPANRWSSSTAATPPR